MKKQSCKTCAHWDIDRARDVAGRVRHDLVAKCMWPVPTLPESIYRSRELGTGWMSGSSGQSCPTYIERKKENTDGTA